MASGLETIIYPVKDLAVAKQLFGTAFGVPPYIDEPYYVAFNVGGQDVGLDPNGHAKGMTGPVTYWRVDDINESLAALIATGERHGVPGRKFLEAAVVGYETIIRIGLGIDAPKLFAHGWWPSAVCGAFGVAAA